MAEFDRGEVRANGLRFHYLTMGEGPLALCLHGFPDSPHTYRYLLPELAEAGYLAVAPFNRGFAPTEVPSERRHVHTSTMVADAIALHEALGGRVRVRVDRGRRALRAGREAGGDQRPNPGFPRQGIGTASFSRCWPLPRTRATLGTWKTPRSFPSKA